jgi:energy-coupling factor transporter ATP-binding protein EcfA2
MAVSSHLSGLGSLELAELAARAWLGEDWTALGARPRSPSQAFRSNDGRRALWVSLEGVGDTALLTEDLVRSPELQELIWLDLRAPGSPLLDLSTFAPHITSRGLADLLEAIEQDDALAPWSRARSAPPQLEPADALWAWMSVDLVAEQFVRMAATGGDNARKTSLKRVFTDLPLQHRGENDLRFVEHVLRVAAGAGLGLFGRHHGADRMLLVGGPGQGKTTLGQHLCQAHRAAMLRTFGAPLSPEAAALVEELDEAADAVTCQRIPLFITLHRFADALAQGEVDTVEAWVARHANARLEAQRITPELVDGWLRRWPALIVFDGLDEVPPSANREPMLAAVLRFLARHEGHDLVVIASTRPQGYRGELDGWATLQLADLEPDDVHRYGEKLYASWVPHDAARRAELLKRLDQASTDPTTSHLARSPLQVLILAALVEQSGRPPRERWRLFREYFRIILDRERERQFAAVLRDHQDLIERLHAELGYRAQLAGELAGGTSDGLRRSDVAEIVRALLQADHQDPATIDDLVDRIDRAVFDRLVFLSGEGDDRVRFDVRSLQEFFAAERLFLGPEALVARHLEAIAGSAHWRNVLLFAVGRLVAERPHLLDRIDPLCDAVDAVEGGLGGVAGSGMRLALWLLTDGAVAAKPRMVEVLLRRVIERVGELEEDDEGVLRNAAGDWLRDVLLPHLIHAAQGGARNIAHLWFELRREGGEQSEAELDAARIQQEPWVIDALSGSINHGLSALDLHLAVLARRRLPLRDALWFYDVGPHLNVSANWSWLQSPHSAPFDGVTDIHYLPIVHDDGPSHPSWAILEPWSRFVQDPTAERLADVLTCAEVRLAPDDHVLRDWAPWPIAAIAALPRSSWPAVLDRLRAGALGSATEWSRANRRWVDGKVRDEDLVAALRSPLPFTAEIGDVGVPLGCILHPALVTRAQHLAQKLDDHTLREAISRWMTAAYEREASIQSCPEAQDLDAFRRRWYRLTLLPSWWQDDAWLTHLADIAAWSVAHEVWTEVIPTPEAPAALLPASRRHPWLLRWLVDLPDLDPTELATIPASFEDPRLTWVALLLRLPLLTPDEAPTLATWMKAHEDSSAWGLPRVPDRLVKHAPPGATLLLRLMLEAGLGDPVALRRAIRDLLSARPTSLQSPAVARDHGLPLPLRPQAVVPPADDPMQPVHLRSLAVQHLRVWADQTLTLRDPTPDRGSWLFFVGPNGSGKTTLLRGLALSLLDAPTADKLLPEIPGTLVATGAEEARVTLTFSDDRHAAARVRGSQVVPNGPPPDLFVVAYGPRRGTLLGVTRQEVRFQPAEAVETLFIEGGNLIHAPSWLKDLHTARLEQAGGEGSVILDAVLDALKQLLPGVTAIDVSSAGVTVRLRGSGPLLLEALSDGYLTTAGWVIDLVARWVDRQRARGRSITPDLLSRMTGLVLIDEIDLHLHPRWQWAVVDTMRELFPRMSFVATTHNPITLLGAMPGEVAVIEVGPSGRSVATMRDIPRGTNAEELLTGPWFGLPSTVDRDTLKLLDEQRLLLRQGGDPARLAGLEAELNQRLGRSPGTGVEREAERMLALERRRRLEEMTPDEREQAKQRAVEALRRAARR